MNGLIIRNISNDYTVLSGNKTYMCKSRGKFRNLKITPLVGDKVIFDDKQKYIMEISPRTNFLVRPPMANIDQTIIVTSVVEPDFSTNLLDKLILVVESSHIKPVICLTKLDLLNDKFDINKYINYYKSIGYEVYRNDQLKALESIFKDKITVLAGQSGSGKSTLLNKFSPVLNLKTDIISKALGRGKHTTRHIELIPLLEGFIADTPGFSSIDLTSISKNIIRDSFVEFNLYKDHCEYKDCMHNLEINCEIKRKVKEGKILESRYENYLKFLKG